MVKRNAKLALRFTCLLQLALLAACVSAPPSRSYPQQPPAPVPTLTPTPEVITSGIPADITEPGSPEAIPPRQTDVFHGPTTGANRQIKQNPAVVALLDRSYAEQQLGNLDSASSTVERGMRIAPQDATLWQRLAEIRMQQGLLTQAIEVARKSNSLGQGMRHLIRENWLLIARAHDLLGQPAARQAALAEANRY